MKKLFLLLFVGTLLVSCSSDESSDGVNGGDPILGTWTLTSILENGVEVSTTCNKQSTITFNSDGTVAEKFYGESNTGPCELESSATASWTKNSNGTYSIGVSTATVSAGNLIVTNNEDGISTVITARK